MEFQQNHSKWTLRHQRTDLMKPLIEKVWKEGEAPTDWKKGYLFKLPKKGDLGQCKNWRGIMPLSTPSKVLSRIIPERINTHTLDEKIRPKEQAGFRRNKSCIDQIATLRIIIEQSLEWQSALHLNFIDFEKAGLRQRRSRGDPEAASLLRGATNKYTPHPTTVR